MAWQVILPLAASLIQGGIAGGLQANQAARENKRNRLIARMRRKELQPLIDRLREARDYFGVEEHFVRDFSRASDQMAAQKAQSGMTDAGSGGLDQVRADALGAGLASLAQFKAQEDARRQQLLAQILSDPSLYAGNVPAENGSAQTMWGALGGGAAGLGSALNSFISTEEGMAALGSLFGAKEPVSVPTPEPQVGGTAVSLPTPVPTVANTNPTGQQGGRPSPSFSPAVYNPNRSQPYYTR